MAKVKKTKPRERLVRVVRISDQWHAGQVHRFLRSRLMRTRWAAGGQGARHTERTCATGSSRSGRT